MEITNMSVVPILYFELSIFYFFLLVTFLIKIISKVNKFLYVPYFEIDKMNNINLGRLYSSCENVKIGISPLLLCFSAG